jgi:hypothetical protein
MPSKKSAAAAADDLKEGAENGAGPPKTEAQELQIKVGQATDEVSS